MRSITPEYLADGVVLFEGDNKEIMPRLGEFGIVVDALLTDPPYGISEGRRKNVTRSMLAESRDYGDLDWDDTTADEGVAMAVSLAKYSIVFGGNYYNLPPSPCWLVWDKMNGETHFADCELAWTNLKRAARLKQHRWHGMIREGNEKRFHPTQKPLEVVRWALRQLPPITGQVLDPFAGSGTTGIACMLDGRDVVMIEKNPEYCEIIRDRVRRCDGRQPGTLTAMYLSGVFDEEE